MKTKKIIMMLLAMLMVCILSVGCSGNTEKKKEIQTKYAELVEQFNALAEPYTAVMDSLTDTQTQSYEEVGKFISDFGSIKLDDKKESELDTLLTDIADMKGSVKQMKDYLDGVSSESQGEESQGEESQVEGEESEGGEGEEVEEDTGEEEEVE